jgi:hypothetical protein
MALAMAAPVAAIQDFKAKADALLKEAYPATGRARR